MSIFIFLYLIIATRECLAWALLCNKAFRRLNIYMRMLKIGSEGSLCSFVPYVTIIAFVLTDNCVLLY